MEVTFGQAGQQGLPLQVEHPLIAVGVLAPVRRPADVRDPVALDADGSVVDGLAAVAVDQPCVEKQCRRAFQYRVRHSYSPPVAIDAVPAARVEAEAATIG